MVYVFNPFPLQDWAWRPVDLKVGDQVSSLWVNFAKTGIPGGAGLPKWPAFDANAEVLLDIGDVLKAGPAPNKSALDFIDELPPAEPRR
jgi:para-nitrobenzyl esterase